MTLARSGEADAYHERLIASLRGYGDPARAEKDQLYHKSSWLHWGVTAPQMEAAIRETLDGAGPDTLMRISRDLWPEPVWDLKIVAARILARKSVPPDERLWEFVALRLGDLDAWAVADNMASLASRCLIADPRRLDAVETWVESGHLWTRRASLVFTLPWTRSGRDPERMLGWARRLTCDREWFIQKAIGWWLRELGKRDPDRVRRFLAEHGAGLKGFARREAEKYLDR
jgi:3-methyladenine DNA glycosylase AlkD